MLQNIVIITTIYIKVVTGNTASLVIRPGRRKENECLREQTISRVPEEGSVVSRSLTDGRAVVESLTSRYRLPWHAKANSFCFVFFSIYFYFGHLTLCGARKHRALVSRLRFNAIAQRKIPSRKGPKLRTRVIRVPRCRRLSNALLSSLQRKSPADLKPVLHWPQR